ncbi:MAG: DUF624 domain-containing protein [Anaerolineae bacterium]|nr:DUF624 domain-containing protein [Anaerolineae bacterium]
MIAGLRVCWRAIRHLNHKGHIYIWANLLWVGLSLPIITAPAAWAGLVKMSHRAHTQPTASIDDFWEGFRENLKRGAVMALLNVVVIGINLFNLLSYASAPPTLPVLMLRWLWIFILVIWFMGQLFMWPLFYEMKQPSLVGALRNALVMIALNPVFTLGVGLGAGLVMAFSTLLVAAWILLTGSLLAIIGTGAVLDRLVMAGLHAPLSDPTVIESPVDSMEG